MTATVNDRSVSRPTIEGIKIIDADTHLTEPGDLWTTRAPAKYKELVPRVELANSTVRTINDQEYGAGTYVWVIDKDTVLGRAGGASVINKHNVKVKGTDFKNWPLTEISPAASFIEPRLDLMDEVGIWAQIVYPNVVGFGGQAFGSVKDTVLRNLSCTIWNDAMIDMAQESGGRLNGMAVLPWWDIPQAVAEVARVQSLGLKGVNISADPQSTGLPDLAELHWEPLWEACASLNMPINFHIGASQTQFSWSGTSPWPSFDDNRKMAIGSSMLVMGNARVVANLILSGILDRHPTLKFVSVESGIGWIPFMLESLDYQASENNVKLSMAPSEYFHRQMYACFWFESQDVLRDIERLGFDNCMYETDFPHPTCLYPDPLDGISRTLAAVDYDVRVKPRSACGRRRRPSRPARPDRPPGRAPRAAAAARP